MSQDSKSNSRRAVFGRRKGHKLTARHAALMETLLPRLALDLSTCPTDLASLFSCPVQDVWLEIGFGAGEHMIAQSQAHPRIGIIGVEPFVNGMARTLAAIAEKSLSNFRLHHGDAIELLAWLPRTCLGRAYLLYPDPWPKRRHWKRRFVQEESIAAVASALRPGGEFRFATDISDYADWTLRHMLRSPYFEWTAACADDWRRAWPCFEGTRYEQKARREGRVPCYLTFRRTSLRC
jgi:tRNA (guanine-N7-)-methyltransferase